ncbi:MAG: ATP-binding protein [Lachnospiraceae bacterium]|nr:ATP-binding protein [Lachnospiraceae bacterium]
MKAITEDFLRYELRSSQPEVYVIPEGKILTPAAREYLQQRKIRVEKAGGYTYTHQLKAPVQKAEQPEEKEAQKQPEPKKTESKSRPHVVATEVPQPEEVEIPVQVTVPKPKYVDYETNAFYYEKPEHMTQLFGNKLVCKDHPRILFRGKLDALQADVVLAQAMIQAAGGSQSLIEDLADVLKDLREMMKCEVLDEKMDVETIIGLTHEELRAQSHNPMKYYKIKQMVLPDYTMGTEYAWLNRLRTAIRETEVAACQAFHSGKTYIRTDIIEELNRLSSALHIMMCRHLAGWYSEADNGGNE